MMPAIFLVLRSYSLILISAFDTVTPFVRMLLLSHFLDLRELGFASALAATYSFFEQTTDFALYRFVFTAPREEFESALASAHALSLLRGLVVGALAVAAAPFIAAALSLRAEWTSFAILGGVILARSFEHLAPRIAERDYQYAVQLKVNLISNGLGLATLLGSLLWAPSHNSLIASLFGQFVGMTIASQWLSQTRYRVRFRSQHFVRAFRFGYPLMFNGLGLALSAQGDRFLVGATLGLPALGVYAVATLVTVVPMSMISRIVSTFLLAAFYNASEESADRYFARIKLAARAVPLISGLYGVGILTLMNVVTPKLFGSHFVLSRPALALLALSSFVRLARGDPFASMLLHEGRTRRLALINLSSISALLFELGLLYISATFVSVFLGKLLGEILALAVALFATFDRFRPALRDYVVSAGASVGVLAATIALVFAVGLGERLLPGLVASATVAGLFGLWTMRFAPPLVRAGYPGAAVVPGASADRQVNEESTR